MRERTPGAPWRNKIACHAGPRGRPCVDIRAPVAGLSPRQVDEVETYFTRVNVVVLQNTAATHPARSTVSLLFTVRVPE